MNRLPIIRTHKTTGWTRTLIDGMGSLWEIHPTDGSPARVVRFLPAHSWAADPNDCKDNQQTDRVVLIDGPALPDWAQQWLESANAKSCRQARAALQAAIDDADWHQDSRDGW